MKPVFVVATANDISALPPELLRKGRFDEIFFVDLPSRRERGEIFRLHLGKRLKDPQILGAVRITDESCLKLAEATEGFIGAEIEQVVVAALFEAFAESRALPWSDFGRAIKATVPLSTTQAERIAEIRDWASKRAVPASVPEEVGVRAARRLAVSVRLPPSPARRRATPAADRPGNPAVVVHAAVPHRGAVLGAAASSTGLRVLEFLLGYLRPAVRRAGRGVRPREGARFRRRRLGGGISLDYLGRSAGAFWFFALFHTWNARGEFLIRLAEKQYDHEDLLERTRSRIDAASAAGEPAHRPDAPAAPRRLLNVNRVTEGGARDAAGPRTRSARARRCACAKPWATTASFADFAAKLQLPAAAGARLRPLFEPDTEEVALAISPRTIPLTGCCPTAAACWRSTGRVPRRWARCRASGRRWRGAR